MAFRVYKPGQGARSRVAGLVIAGVVALFGARWLRGELIEASPGWSYGVSIGFAVVVMGLVLWLANWPRLVDLLIETETELNKVSWSSRRDVWRSTLVVIFTIAFMATFMFAVVRVLQPIFRWAKVLVPPEKTSMQSAPAEWPWSSPHRLATRPPPPASRPTDDG